MEPKRKFRGIRAAGKRYEARVMFGTRRRSIGMFDTIEEALAAYEAAKSEARLLYPSITRPELTQRRLKELFHYAPEIGVFTRLTDAGGKSAGSSAGGQNKTNKYRHLRIDGRRYPEHQLAWLYMTGEMPPAGIDHRDGERTNNCFTNLRPATQFENGQNRQCRPNTKTGLLGVNWHAASRKFQARIMVNRKMHHLGYFNDPTEAHRAYLEAKRRLHLFQPVPRDI
jgi:hypothetical protein